MLTRRTALKAALVAASSGVLAAGDRSSAQSALDGLRGALDAGDEGLQAGSEQDQSGRLAAALAKAEAGGQALFLPPGRYRVREIELPRHAHIAGVPGHSRLVFSGGAFMLRANRAATLRLNGVTLDGASLALDPASASLLDVDGADDVAIDDCGVVDSAAAGLSLRGCAGRVARCRVEGVGTVGIHLSQSRGMAVTDNVVAQCGNSGILVQRDEKGDDGTIVRGNRVSAVRADAGGTGQNGNGINTDRANGVMISDNRVDGSAFSAIRCFSSENVQITGNSCVRSGEIAIYVEFAFEGAVVASNLVDGAVGGIAFPNFMEHGGRLAVCTGNLVRNIRGGAAYPDGNPQLGAGISAEADAALTGNVVENARWGLQLGWGPYLRDISATGNVIRDCPLGIGASVAEGAGTALISGNLISGATRGAIVGMRWQDAATDDLAVEGADVPANLTVANNRTG